MVQTHAFISYVRENRDDVDRLAEDLRIAGVKVWLDRNDIMPGQYWKEAINEAIQQGAFFIACYSKELNERQEAYVHGELRLAIDRLRLMPKNRVWFIPVLLSLTEIPAHSISDHETLRDINAVRLDQDWEKGLSSILRAMKLDDPAHRRALHLIDLIRYHPAERDYAVSQLRQMDVSSDAVPFLIEVFGDHETEARWYATVALGNIGLAAAKAVPALIKVLGDSDAGSRQRAADALGQIGPAAVEAVPALIKVLSDADARVRQCAADALGRIGPAAVEAVSALIKALSDADEETRQRGAEALGRIGPAAVEAVPMLIKVLEDASWREESTGIAAARALGDIGPAAAEAVPALAAALSDWDRSWLRAPTATALGNIGSAAVPALTKELLSPYSQEAELMAAADALRRIGSAAAETVPALIVALGKGNRKARLLAVDVLGDIGPAAAEAVPALAAALRDWDRYWLRPPAAIALGKIGSAAVPTLTDALRHDDPEVRQLAAEALGRIGSAAVSN